MVYQGQRQAEGEGSVLAPLAVCGPQLVPEPARAQVRPPARLRRRPLPAEAGCLLGGCADHQAVRELVKGKR